jgi:putative ABC transport system permease protein
MAIINIILRKMLNNRWLVGSLFLGLLITSSLVSSIPTYSSSVLSKLLIKELENYQIENNKFPGEFSFFVQIPKDSEFNSSSYVKKIDQINTDITNEAKLPIQSQVTVISTTPLAIIHQDQTKAQDKKQPFGSIKSFSNIEKHIEITNGRLPNKSPVEGVYEALVPETALIKRDIVLDTIFIGKKGTEQLLIKPVGTFKAKDERDSYWFTAPESYSNDFIFLEETFSEKFLKENTNLIETIRMFTGFDYYSIEENQLETLVGMERKTKTAISEINDFRLFIEFPTKEILTNYKEKSSQLKTMIWSLNVPLFIMLAIYLYMVTRLIVERQLNEISILNSRGAKRSQILLIYFIELTLLSVIAFIFGPYLGLLLCNVLGATNGFLEFVQRSSLHAKIMKEAFIYEFWAILLSIAMMMIPIYQASRQSIVNHKRDAVRVAGNVLWYTIFIELSLLGISLYGWLTFNRRKQELMTLENGGESFTVDPLLFFVPAAFIIGLGLLSLRIYPFLLKAIFKLGKKYWSISLYSTLIQVSRSSKQYLYLMLFLIMTIAVGVFSASAARTINSNLEEQIRYENGADLAVEVKWESESSEVFVSSPIGSTTENNDEENKDEFLSNEGQNVYTEPPFDPFLKLKNIEHVTKVFRKENIDAGAKGEVVSSVEMMAIEPKSFGQTAWFKTSLLTHHWHEYLNLLAMEHSAVLMSESVASKLGVKTGDYVTLKSSNSNTVEFVVYGIIEYWPGFNPLKEKDGDESKNPSLVVANLAYVQNMMGLEPYGVWMKVKPSSSRAELYEEIKTLGIPLTKVSDVQPKLTELKNGAFLLGINGSLSLGFMISIIITLIGFLIYWILTMKSRVLQYGIYRAMGIPLPKLIGILLYEQLLTSGVACALGIAIGGLTSDLFVPLFQLSFNPKNVVPPFQVIFDSGDALTIYSFVIFILFIGLTVLAILLKNIRIHQAIKLGED